MDVYLIISGTKGRVQPSLFTEHLQPNGWGWTVIEGGLACEAPLPEYMSGDATRNDNGERANRHLTEHSPVKWEIIF